MNHNINIDCIIWLCILYDNGMIYIIYDYYILNVK